MYKADDKFDVVQLEKKEVTYSVLRRPAVRVHGRQYNQFEGREESLGDAPQLPRDGCSASDDDLQRSHRLSNPTSVEREIIIYTEPAVRAYLGQGAEAAARHRVSEVSVPLLFVAQGDRIEIDTRTGDIAVSV